MNKRGEIPFWLGMLVLGLLVLVLLIVFNRQVFGFISDLLGNIGRII